MNGEPPGFGLFFDDEQQGDAPTVGPLDEQRHIEFAETITEPFLELLLTHGQNAGGLQVPGFGGGEEFQRRPRIVEDQILEVLVVGHESSCPWATCLKKSKVSCAQRSHE